MASTPRPQDHSTVFRTVQKSVQAILGCLDGIWIDEGPSKGLEPLCGQKSVQPIFGRSKNQFRQFWDCVNVLTGLEVVEAPARAKSH